MCRTGVATAPGGCHASPRGTLGEDEPSHFWKVARSGGWSTAAMGSGYLCSRCCQQNVTDEM